MIKKMLKFFLIFIALVVVAGCTPGNNPDNNDPNGNNPGGTPQDPSTYEYVTPVTDELKLTEDYEGKNFIEDGIGEVTVSQYIDGDTTVFVDENRNRFTVRYLGVDTPESTYRVDPWGYAASNHTKNQLKNAKKIVLQCDDLENRFDSTTSKRYLAWVWLIDENGDSRLLNLELTELALCWPKSKDTSLDAQFTEAILKVSTIGCRIYGETDPSYDYSTESLQISLKDLRTTYGTKEATLNKKDQGKKIVVSGVVTRMLGRNSCFVQQYDEETDAYYGVYVYGGFNTQAAFGVGNSVVIEGKIGYYSGSLQITDVKAKVHSWADDANPEKDVFILDVADPSTLTKENTNLMGRIVKLENLTVVDGYDTSTSEAFTLECTYVKADGSTGKIDIRIDANVALKDANGDRIDSYTYYNGKTFESVIAAVSYYDYDTEDGDYDGNVQLMITSQNDIVIAE